MGFVVGAIVAIMSALALYFGRAEGLALVALISLQSLLWVAGLVFVARGGHRAFKTGANTDVVAYCLVLAVYMSASITWWGGS